MDNELLARITLNPAVCHGKPTIRNTRYMVSSLLELLAAGDGLDDLLADHKHLEKDDIFACLLYAAKMVNFRTINNFMA